MKQGFKTVALLLIIGLAMGGLLAGTELLLQQRGAGEVANSLTPSAGNDQIMAGVQIGGDFDLTNHKGERVNQDSWPDQYKLVYFGFTHCPDVCPLGLNTITDALNELPAAMVAKITPIFITVDPARDTVAEMADYVSLYHPKLVGLTGTRDELEHVADQYRVYTETVETPVNNDHQHMNHDDHAAMRHGASEPMITVNHSAFTYVMSPEGDLIDTFSSDTPAAEMAARLTEIVK